MPLAHVVVGNGPPLLLLAGTGYAGGTWGERFLGPLAERFTVVTLDYRGTGTTPGTAGDYSTRLFAADALALLQELGLGPVHVLGHSMGGRVAQWVGLDGRPMVRSLVMAASGPGQYRADRPQVGGIPVDTCVALVENGYQAFIAAQINRTFFTPEFIAAHPAPVQGLIDAFWAHRPGLRDYLKHVVARQQHQTVERLAELTQPALVLVGDRDTHAGGTGSHLEQSQYLATHLPAAEFRLVRGAAHGCFWSHPDVVVAELTDFLARHP